MNTGIGTTVLRCTAIATACLLSACSEDPANGVAAPETATSGEATSAVTVAVLGGDTSRDMVGELAQVGITNARAAGGLDLAERAELVSSSDVAIIVVDATFGPSPSNREDVLLCRQFARGPVFVGFTRTTLVDDRELLELEELEIRELLKTYDLPGDTATVFFDVDGRRTKYSKELRVAAREMKGVASSPEPNANREHEQAFEASLYVLADLEAHDRGIVQPIHTDHFALIFADRVVEATVEVENPILPGAGGLVKVRLDEEAKVPLDARFVIERKGHILAAGFRIDLGG